MKKIQLVEELTDLLNNYNTIAIVSLYKTRAQQLQQLSRKFRQDICMKVAKNNLFKRALSNARKPSINNLVTLLKGPSMLLLTDMGPFELAILLGKNKMRMTAKARDIAQDDIVVPAGNTGLPPGPMMSELHEIGIRTKIDLGSVWVVNDVIIVKKGESIQPNIASALTKLGYKPIEAGLDIVAASDGDFIFASDQLQPKLDEVKKNLEDAATRAFNLAFNTLYLTSETIGLILRQAHLTARNVAVNSNYPATEVMCEIIAKAHSHMTNLSAMLGEVSA